MAEAAAKKTETVKTADATPAAVAAAPATAAKERSAPATVLGINTTLAMPTNTAKRGNKTKYDFAGLEVGHSIGVKGRKAASMASTVSQAIRSYREPKRDAQGGIVYKLKDGVATNEQELVNTRHFFVVDTDPKSDPEGAECRIWRDK